MQAHSVGRVVVSLSASSTTRDQQTAATTAVRSFDLKAWEIDAPASGPLEDVTQLATSSNAPALASHILDE